MELENFFLHYSKIGNNAEILKLIESGVNINCTDSKGDNALSLAAREGLTQTVEILLEAGVDYYNGNASGYTPLIVAAMECHSEVVKAILTYSRKKSSRTKPSIVALMAANSLELRGCSDTAHLLRNNPG